MSVTFNEAAREWLGELPAAWLEAPVRRVLSQKVTDGPHETPEFVSEGVPFLSVDGIQDGELVFEGCRHISRDAHEVYARKVQPRKNDILMGKAASTGKIARVKTSAEFNIWSPLAVLRPSSEVDAGYLEYALKSLPTQAQIEVLCTSNTQKNISMADIPRIIIGLPRLPTQKAIADFLDRKTAAIDTLIEKKQRLLALLAEKRAALINQAVTKGLNPNVSMKYSGISTVGTVPQHWRVVRNKVLVREVADLSQTGEEELLTVSHITGVTKRAEKDVTMFLAATHVGYKRVSPGDLVINTMWAWMAALGTSREQGIVSPAYGVYRLDQSQMDPSFYDLFYRTPQYVVEMTRYSKGVWSSRLRLYPESFLGLLVVVPPLSEQRNILSAIENEVGKFPATMKRLSASIERLQEYRQALITAAVTGQLDIGEEAA